MPWAEIGRRDLPLRCRRHSSNLTDREWGLIAPLFCLPTKLGPPLRDGPSRCGQCDPMHRPDRLPMEPAAEGIFALHDRAALLLRLAEGRSAVCDQPPAGLGGALEGASTWRIEIIKRSDAALGLEIFPRRWMAKRTFAWLGRSRRPARDWKHPSAAPRPDS